MKLNYLVVLASSVCMLSYGMERDGSDQAQRSAALQIVRNDEKEKKPATWSITHTSSGTETPDSSESGLSFTNKRERDLEGGFRNVKSLQEEGGSIIIDTSGKKISVAIDLKQIGENLKQREQEIDLSQHHDHDTVCKQMVRDLLQIVIDEEDAHKKKDYKIVRSRLERMLKNNIGLPQNEQAKEQLECLRKFSLGQLTSRLEAKKTKRNSPLSIIRPASSPREMFLMSNRAQGEVAISELQKLLLSELAQTGISERKQKLLAVVFGGVGTVAASFIAWAFTYYSK